MSDLYPFYKNARDLAWQVLFKKKITSFPINMIKLLHEYGIKTKPFSKCKKFLQLYNVPPDTWAFTTPLNGVYHTAYNDHSTPEQLRFTLAHELGHILTNFSSDFSEIQANIFARDLLMPAIVCKIENLTTPQQISDFFGISITAATIRAKRVEELLKRDKWLTSPLEKQYFNLYLKRKKTRL